MNSAGICLTLVLVCGNWLQAGSRVRPEIGVRQRVRISSLIENTCVVLDDGTVRCWGQNDHGQLGDGTVTAFKTLPVQVSNLFAVVSVAVGGTHSCALIMFGQVQCWGQNDAGQLGNGNTQDSSTPVGPSLDGVVSITAGAAHTCALRVDGTVWCWGANYYGQSGASGTASVVTPNRVALSHGPAVAIASGFHFTCALTVDARIQCWGSNFSGELGSSGGSFSATPMLLPAMAAVDVYAGEGYACAGLTDGTAVCWGSDYKGQIGDGSVTAITNPKPPTAISINNVISMTGGNAHSCALLANGTVTCWGDNSIGQLADGTHTAHLTPGTAAVGLSNIVALTSGSFFSCSLDVAGTVRCWGDNSQGTLGNGTTAPTSLPSTVTGISGSIGAVGLAEGDGFSCARRGNGQVSCWGTGALGNGGTGTQASPNPVNVSGLTGVARISAGETAACGLQANGTASCWGNIWDGFSGQSTGQTHYATPSPAPGSFTNIIGMAPGLAQICSLLADGSVRCWGLNLQGELGDGTLTNSATPVPVKGLSGVIALSSGNGHVCAVRFDHTVRCWGDNSSGQLGDNGTETFSGVPVTVLGLNDAIAISAGAQYTCALSASGVVHCWGDNGGGQLGNGDRSRRLFPDLVSGLTDAIAVAAGQFNTCVVRAEGSASCWGENTSQQLAAADSVNHLSPTSVIGSFASVKGVSIPIKLNDVIGVAPQISAPDASASCALLSFGRPECWGDNHRDQIGDGTTTNQPRPTIVNSFTANVDPAVTVKPNGIATVTALVNCELGGQVHLYLTLEQGSVTGNGVALEACTGGLAEILMTVPAQGTTGFTAGAAIAHVEAIITDRGLVRKTVRASAERAEAIVRDRGFVTEDQHWTRDVTISVVP